MNVMKDAKGHGSETRRGEADPRTQADVARFKARTMRKRNSSGGGGSGAGSGGGGAGSGGGSSGAHTSGIHKATKGKTLAQLSAAGTNPNIPPPTIGGRK